MAYKKDQGRFARMTAFWALFLLLGYGCVRPGGLVQNVREWLNAAGGRELNEAVMVDPFPILGRLDVATLIALAVLAIGVFVVNGFLNRPKIADLLIDTEAELRKVTWPTMSDTWKGTIAVVFTVAFMLVYLTTADIAIQFVMQRIMGGR